MIAFAIFVIFIYLKHNSCQPYIEQLFLTLILVVSFT